MEGERERGRNVGRKKEVKEEEGETGREERMEEWTEE